MVLQFLFLVLNLFLILFLIFLIIELLNFLIKRIPHLPTSSRAIKAVLKILESQKEKRKTFVDLGCGMARVLIALKRQFPEMEVLGYENCLSQFFLAKTRIFFSKEKIKVFFKDFFEADLRDVDIIYCYLTRDLLTKLEKKFEKELKSEALIISNTFPLPHWKPTQVILTNQKNPNFEKLFIYEKKISTDKFESG